MVKILCVEDEAHIREDLVEFLEDEGFEVLEAGNGEEALNRLASGIPDLVISDISMPKMNGHELLKALQDQSPKYDDLPFIFLSAHSDRQDIFGGMDLGADDYLTKPVDYELMLTRINSVLRRVSRMQQKKQQEQVKLYKALSGQDPQEPGGASGEGIRIIVVGGTRTRALELVQHLEGMHYDTQMFTSGREFCESAPDLSADLIVLWLNTDDIQGHTLSKLLTPGTAPNLRRRVLVNPPDLPNIGSSMLEEGYVEQIFVEPNDIGELEISIRSMLSG